MHADTIPIHGQPETPAAAKKPGKLRREFGRLLVGARVLAMRPRALRTHNQFVFILGHMRSGSSLLCHLLCDSDEVVGYGETHNNYRRKSDLAKLLVNVHKVTGHNPLEYRYVLDKIVGTKHVVAPGVLKDERTRYIFLVREPMSSLASIAAMRKQYHAHETPDQILAFAANHYTERLAQLRELAATIGDRQRALLVTHQQIVGETSAAFLAMESFLDLSETLREDYQVMPTTGQPGIGDPSPNIRLGKISRSLPKKSLEMPPALRADLEACYASCIRELGGAMHCVGASRMPMRRAA